MIRGRRVRSPRTNARRAWTIQGREEIMKPRTCPRPHLRTTLTRRRRGATTVNPTTVSSSSSQSHVPELATPVPHLHHTPVPSPCHVFPCFAHSVLPALPPAQPRSTNRAAPGQTYDKVCDERRTAGSARRLGMAHIKRAGRSCGVGVRSALSEHKNDGHTSRRIC